MTADVVIAGGVVHDGTGAPGRRADVAIADGHIVTIGDDVGSGRRVIDATDRVVSPGFIDIHTHSDQAVLLDPSCQSKVAQGVTTDVTGNCGASPIPIEPSRLDRHYDQLKGRGLSPTERPVTWTDFEGYAAEVDAGRPAFNIAPLIGHHSLRTAAMGLDQRAPTDDEMDTMRRLLALQLDQGAFGFSTGLTLVPGTYAAEDEIVALCEVVASRDALYATHTRGSDNHLDFGGVVESLRTAKAAGARLQYSHAAINIPKHWGKADQVVALIEEARNDGLDVMFDVYPYDASSSALTQYLPSWVQEGGTDAMRARLAEPSVYDRALAEFSAGWFGGIPWFWDRVVLSRVDPPDDWSVGMTIEEAAARAGEDPAAFALRLCLDHGNADRVVLFYRTEEDMKVFLAHPLSMVGSDGSAIPFDQGGEKPHPRSFGTYPRIFGRYVREQQVISLEEAVRKCTGAVADRLGITDRGYLREGAVADVTIFDPATIIDRSTFTEPAQAPVGVDHVLVAGQVVIDGGDQTDARPGKVLRRPGHDRGNAASARSAA